MDHVIMALGFDKYVYNREGSFEWRTRQDPDLGEKLNK